MGLLEGLVVGQVGGDPVDDGELGHVHVVPVGVEQLRDDAAVGQGYLELTLDVTYPELPLDRITLRSWYILF